MKSNALSGFVILLLFLTPLLLSAQGKEANNWYFGYKTAITFNQGSPPTALLDSEMIPFLGEGTGCATISDTLGQLQFYTDGVH
ncbi:MAG TPA: hypothetical protein VHO68_15830, partial [Bacteroidales bacterium]|nr:hypothetical protein [Bacteroidales bacterium]